MRDDELFEAFSDIDRYYLNEGVPYIKDRRRLSKTGLIVSLVAIIILAMGSFWYFRIHSCGFHLRYQQGEYYLERNARYNFDNYIIQYPRRLYLTNIPHFLHNRHEVKVFSKKPLLF